MNGPFVHLGLVFGDSDDLVATVLPEVRAALAAGDVVVTIVDRRTAHRLREALGEDAAVTSLSPADAWWPGPERLTAELRSLVHDAGGRRVLVLGQYQDVTVDDAAHREACGLVLDDLPLTLLCACPRDADPPAVDAVMTGHAQVLVDGARQANPRFRPPADRSPSPASLWGTRALRLSFDSVEDLRTIRDRVARVAGELGLGADEVDEAVLAVHEAALAATAGTDGVACVLEVRTRGRAMLTEVSGPAPVDGQAEQSEQSLHIVRLVAGPVTTHDGAGTRAVRVLTDPERSSAAAR